MDLNLAKTKNIMDEIGSGTLFDDTLAGSIGSLSGGVTDTIAILKTANIPDLGPIADDIKGKLNPAALGDLASHVEGNIAATMDKLATFNSFCSIQDAISGATAQIGGSLPEILPNNPLGDLAPIAKAEAPATAPSSPAPAANKLLNKAFGAMLAARSMVTAVSGIKAAVGSLGSLEGLMSTATGALAKATADHAAGLISSSDLAQFQEAKDNAERTVASAKSGINTMAKNLATNLGSVHQKIADEKAFFEGATSELTKFADAMKIQTMFASSPASQAVMGALGSPSLLSKLRDAT